MAASDGAGFSSSRVTLLAGALVIGGAVLELAVGRSLRAAISLTAAGTVAIINFRWLEALVQRVVQPGRPRFDRWSMLRLGARMLLFGAAVAALAFVPRVDFVAVTLGVSAVVVSLVVEGVRWGSQGGG